MNLNSGYLELFAEPQHQSHTYTRPDFGKISKYCYLTSHTQSLEVRIQLKLFYHIMKCTLYTEMYNVHWAPKVTFINFLLGLFFSEDQTSRVPLGDMLNFPRSKKMSQHRFCGKHIICSLNAILANIPEWVLQNCHCAFNVQ